MYSVLIPILAKRMCHDAVLISDLIGWQNGKQFIRIGKTREEVSGEAERMVRGDEGRDGGWRLARGSGELRVEVLVTRM